MRTKPIVRFMRFIGLNRAGTLPWIGALTVYTLLLNLRILMAEAHFPFDFEGFHFPLLHYLYEHVRYGLRVELQDDAFFHGHFKLLYAQGTVVLFELVD